MADDPSVQLAHFNSESVIVAAYAWSRDGKKFALTRVAEPNLEATGYTLNDDLIAILKSQLCFLLTGIAGEAFQDWASELKSKAS
jgi:hypothetical protein